MAIFLFIFFLSLLAYGLLIDYYRRRWNAIDVFQLQQEPQVSVSVVVAVRNEERSLPALLASLHAQDYPADLWELIVVDDHSSDATAQIFEAADSRDVRGKYIRLPTNKRFKKAAIARGVQAAKGDLIITTDADCTMGPGWIRTIASFHVSTGSKFIAAPVLPKRTRSLLGIFQLLDFLSLQGITGAAVETHLHSMCNGANLAYSRQAFLEVNGFEGIDAIPSGDDMLLMHKIFERYPRQVRFLKSTEALVYTEPQQSWKGFFHQRIRWASKAVHFRDRRVVYVLALTYAVNVFFLVLAIASVFRASWSAFLLLLLVAKILFEFPLVNSVASFFRQRGVMRYFPLLQPVHIFYTIIAGWLGRFGSYTWKARVIKNN